MDEQIGSSFSWKLLGKKFKKIGLENWMFLK